MIKLHYDYTEEIKDFIENGLSTKMEYDEEYVQQPTNLKIRGLW